MPEKKILPASVVSWPVILLQRATPIGIFDEFQDAFDWVEKNIPEAAGLEKEWQYISFRDDPVPVWSLRLGDGSILNSLVAMTVEDFRKK